MMRLASAYCMHPKLLLAYSCTQPWNRRTISQNSLMGIDCVCGVTPYGIARSAVRVSGTDALSQNSLAGGD